MISLTLPVYMKKNKKTSVLLGMNWYRNAHFFELGKIKKNFHEIVAEQCADQKPLRGKVRVRYRIFLKRLGTDGGNVRSVIEKFTLDGLVKNCMIDEDDFSTVTGGDGDEYELDRDNPRAEVEIYQKEEDGQLYCEYQL